MSEMVRIELFGGLRVVYASQVVTRFRTRKTGLLLASLACDFPNRRTREELAELFWPDEDFELGRQNVRTALSSLRRQVEPPGVPAGAVLCADRDSVGLNPQAVTTDVAQFEALLNAAAGAEGCLEKTRLLTDAVELYQGELLAGSYEDWILPERERLAERFFQAVGVLLAHLEESGNLTGAIELAQRAVRADPLREESHCTLIRLQVDAGQTGQALRHYQELERLLESELAVAPSAAARALLACIQRENGVEGTAGASGSKPPAVVKPTSVTPPIANPTRDTLTYLLAEPSADSSLIDLLQRHGANSVAAQGGILRAVFQSAGEAVAGAIAVQKATPAGLRLAMHTGDVGRPGDDVQRVTERLLLAAHPGQILATEATAGLVWRRLEEGVTLVNLGIYRLAKNAPPERLFLVRHPQMAQETFPPPKAEAGYGSNLPLQITRFFGREEEIASLQETLRSGQTRLVTLVGPGGAGKTRLALQAANGLMEAFRGCVWFVSLATVTEPQRMAEAIRDALGLSPGRLAESSECALSMLADPGLDPLEQAAMFLSTQPTLLLLDNLEQLSGAGAHIVQRLLSRVPSLVCLVTSRRELRLPDELRFPVLPLPVPTATDSPEALVQYPGVRLFVDRAQMALPDFQVTARNAEPLALLCHRLEGIPLALELVAARAQILTPAQMLARFGSRLDWDAGQRLGHADRHRTLRTAIDWSYQLLTPEQQRFFARLSVFRGGWTLETATAVCSDGDPALANSTAEYLWQLQSHSLILAEDSDGAIRYRMLETLQGYAAECLEARGEGERLRRQHADFFLMLAETAEEHLRGAEKQVWLNRLDAEHDNLRAALTWAADAAPEILARLAAALAPFWDMRVLTHEGRWWLDAVLEQETSFPTDVRVRVLQGAARLAWYQGDFQRAQSLLEETLDLCRTAGDKRAIIAALLSLADVAHRRCLLDTARSLQEEGLALARELGDNDSIALALYRLGMSVFDSGDFEGALPHLEESLALLRQAGDTAAMAATQSMLGHVFFRLGRFEEATPLLEEALAAGRKINDTWAIVFTEWSLGSMEMIAGNWERAMALFRDGMPRISTMGNKWAVAYGLEGSGYIAMGRGEVGGAVQLLAAADLLRATVGAPLPPSNQGIFQQTLDAARVALGEQAYARFWEAGRAWSSEQALAYAMDVVLAG